MKVTGLVGLLQSRYCRKCMVSLYREVLECETTGIYQFDVRRSKRDVVDQNCFELDDEYELLILKERPLQRR